MARSAIPPRATAPGRRALALLLALVVATGCSSWRKLAPPQDGVAYSRGRPIRVWLDDGQRLELRGLRVDGDSVRGWRSGEEVAIPRARIIAYARGDVDLVRSLTLVAGIVALGYVGILVAYGINEGGGGH